MPSSGRLIFLSTVVAGVYRVLAKGGEIDGFRSSIGVFLHIASETGETGNAVTTGVAK